MRKMCPATMARRFYYSLGGRHLRRLNTKLFSSRHLDLHPVDEHAIINRTKYFFKLPHAATRDQIEQNALIDARLQEISLR